MAVIAYFGIYTLQRVFLKNGKPNDVRVFGCGTRLHQLCEDEDGEGKRDLIMCIGSPCLCMRNRVYTVQCTSYKPQEKIPKNIFA